MRRKFKRSLPSSGPTPPKPEPRGAFSHLNHKGLPKLVYLSEEVAWAKARIQGNSGVYRCPTCTGWHIGGHLPIPIEVDPNLAPGTVEMRYGDTVVGRIENLGVS